MSNIFEKELASLHAAAIDWKKVEDTLNEIIVALNEVAALLPEGLVKNIISGIIAGLGLVLKLLPQV